MKFFCKWMKIICLVFFSICIVSAAVYSFKSFVEIADNIGDCKIKSNYANAKINKAVVMGRKKSNFNIKNSCFEKLCGCIKFSSEDFIGECCVMKSENRLLVSSVSYSAPIFYSYSCRPYGRRYSKEECVEKAKKIVSECIPDRLSFGQAPVLTECTDKNLSYFAVFSVSEDPECKITVGIRSDTLSVVYFDARRLYFSGIN